MNGKQAKPYLMFITSMLIFGSIGIFRRCIPLSSALLACARGLIGSLFLFIFVKIKGRKIRHGIGFRNTAFLAISGGLMGANWLLLFEAYNHTSVAVATLCYYMAPTIVILLSPLVFKEKLTLKKYICVLLSLIGMIFVSGILGGSTLGTSDILGIVLGLAAAILYASVIILNKKIQIEDSYEKTIIQLLAASITLIPYLLITESFSSINLNAFSAAMMSVVGIVHTGIAYALYFGSISSLKGQTVAVLSYIDSVSALMMSALFLREELSIYGLIGAVLIIGAALCSEIDLPLLQKDS